MAIKNRSKKPLDLDLKLGKDDLEILKVVCLYRGPTIRTFGQETNMSSKEIQKVLDRLVQRKVLRIQSKNPTRYSLGELRKFNLGLAIIHRATTNGEPPLTIRRLINELCNCNERKLVQPPSKIELIAS